MRASDVKPILIVVVWVCMLGPSAAIACSDFVVKAKDNTIVNGRSMEFPIELESEILVIPKGTTTAVTNSASIQGRSWTSQHAIIGMNAYHLPGAIVDGMNDAGLSCSGLMFTGATYQPPVAGKYIGSHQVCSWILGNFDQVDEVKKAIGDLVVSDNEIKKIKGLGMHYAIHDVSGKHIVIEFVNGKTVVTDNPTGVMTNRPDIQWHLTNLRNYINLDAHDKKPRTMAGLTIEPTGVGSGLLGLPGDWTPASRFVRLAVVTDGVLPAANEKELVTQAEHILNVVDIPRGVIKENPYPLVSIYGYAQWVVIKDMTHRVLYFKTYDDTEWKKIHLSRIAAAPGSAPKVIAISQKGHGIKDVTDEMK